MAIKHSTEKQKIDWLVSNEDLWIDQYEFHKDILMVKMAKAMKAAGLYQSNTRLDSINVLPLLKKAYKKIESESDGI